MLASTCSKLCDTAGESGNVGHASGQGRSFCGHTIAISLIKPSRCCSKYVFSRDPIAEVERCCEAISSLLLSALLRGSEEDALDYRVCWIRRGYCRIKHDSLGLGLYVRVLQEVCCSRSVGTSCSGLLPGCPGQKSYEDNLTSE